MRTRHVPHTPLPLGDASAPPGVSLSALVAALTGALVLALYVWVIVGQEGDSWRSAVRFGSVMGIGVLAAAVAAFVPWQAVRLGAAAAAAAVFLATAILGALSIGALLLPAAVASLVCLSSTGERVGLRATWAAAVAAGGGALALMVLLI